jgi:aminopeptidase N
MFKNFFYRRLTALAFIGVLAFTAMVQARPLHQSVFVRQDDHSKLPPVNWVRSRKIDVKHLDLDLRFDWANNQAIGTEIVTLAPFSDTDRFNLDAAMMTIDSVALPNSKPLRFNYAGGAGDDNLEIVLDRVYRSGEDVSVKIVYKTNYVNNASPDTAIASFGRGLRFIKPTEDDPLKPRQIWSQGESEFNRYWFPSYDSPNDFRTTDIRVTVDKPLSVVSNGKLVETKENNDNTRTFHWKMDIPYSNYLSSVVVGETTPVVQDFEGVPVYGFGYTNETNEVAATVKNLPATMKFFSEVTGVKYPYPKYSQAFVEDFGGGMENITATTQIEEMIHDERELLDTDSEGLQSHELAHQWFGDYVTCRDWGQIWLNESFATYMQAMWTEKLKGHDEFLYSDVRGNHDKVLGSWSGGDRRPIVTKYYANKDAMFDNYAYPGGASVLHMLRKHLGDQLYSKALNRYLTTNANQPVSTEDLRIAVEETSGQSMDWFFDQWLYRMGHPVFDITQSYDDGSKKLTLNVKQTQKIDTNNAYPQTDFFQSYVDVEIDGRIERVWLKPQAENVFTFDVPVRPRLVNFDYESTLLKEMKFEKSTDELIYQMLNDKDVLGRRWAMGELEKKASDPTQKQQAVAAIVTSAEKDPFWRVRRAALSVLAEIYSPDPPQGQERPTAVYDANALDIIVRSTSDKVSLIRSDAIRHLGETKDAKYADRYLSALNDRSYTVIDEAAVALARTKDPRAFDALVKLTATPSWKGRIQVAGLNGLTELGDARGFETGYKIATDKSQIIKVRRTALGVIGATGKGDARAFPIIFEQFKAALAANDVTGLFNSAYAIATVADPRGQEAFDLLKARFKDDGYLLNFVNVLETRFHAALKK